MAIENDNGAVVMTGRHTALFNYLQIIHGLTLEIRTGMSLSSRGSVMDVARDRSGSPKRTKKGVLIDMVAFTMGQFPEYHPRDNVIEAMGKKYLKRTEAEMKWLREVGEGTEFDARALPEKVAFELHELGAIKAATAELAKESPRFTHTVAAITDRMIGYASNH